MLKFEFESIEREIVDLGEYIVNYMKIYQVNSVVYFIKRMIYTKK